MGKIEIYRIVNIITREWWEGRASSALKACGMAGWKIKYCEVERYLFKGFDKWIKTNKGGKVL